MDGMGIDQITQQKKQWLFLVPSIGGIGDI